MQSDKGKAINTLKNSGIKFNFIKNKNLNIKNSNIKLKFNNNDNVNIENSNTKLNFNNNDNVNTENSKSLKNLKTKVIGKNLNFYKTIDSTQLEIFRRIKNRSIKDGTLIITDLQTDGIRNTW